jgi:hypothetical protein
MQSPERKPLTAEWPLPGGTPFCDALLRRPDLPPTQHGSIERQDPAPESFVMENPLRTESTSTSASTWSTNLTAFGIDSVVKLDFSSQVNIDNSFHGALRQLRQLGLEKMPFCMESRSQHHLPALMQRTKLWQTSSMACTKAQRVSS